MRGSRIPLIALVGMMVAGPVAARAQEKPAPSKPAPAKATTPGAPTDVNVTVAYTGKGTVDDTHEIWVFLFSTPTISAASQPVAVQSIRKSGGTATFKNVTQSPVYIATAFDEKGDYDGSAGPPPPGTPIGMHGKEGVMIAVTPGKAGKVKMSFDESRRMGGQ